MTLHFSSCELCALQKIYTQNPVLHGVIVILSKSTNRGQKYPLKIQKGVMVPPWKTENWEWEPCGSSWLSTTLTHSIINTIFMILSATVPLQKWWNRKCSLALSWIKIRLLHHIWAFFSANFCAGQEEKYMVTLTRQLLNYSTGKFMICKNYTRHLLSV